MSYTKLFNSIITSTIWSEDDKTRIVWITMLAIADKNGEVHGSIPGLARIAGVPVDDTRTAIHKFLSPDLDSRTKDDEGRRIEEIDGGWLLLNHRKYREMASREEAKEAEAKRKARYRAKLARNGKMSHNVPDKSPNVPESLHIAEAEAEAEADVPHSLSPSGGKKKAKRFQKPTPEQVTAYAKTIGFDLDGNRFCDHYEAKGWLLGKSPMKSWQAAVRTWKSNQAEAAKPKQKSIIGIPL
jgi:hypothetical protein